MVFSYCMERLMYSILGWCVVHYTEWCAKMAAFILIDVYVSYHLGALSSTILSCITQMNWNPGLVNRANANESRRLLNIAESTSSTAPSSTWGACRSYDSASLPLQRACMDSMY